MIAIERLLNLVGLAATPQQPSGPFGDPAPQDPTPSGHSALGGVLFGAIVMAALLRGCPDTIAPAVSSTVPSAGATAVSINGNIAATFSEAMDPLTISTATFTLRSGTTPVAGTVSYTGVTATFDPTSVLAPNTLHTATIAGGAAGAADLVGNTLAVPHVWTFTTGPAPDTTAPQVSLTDPLDGATGVPLDKVIAATFSEAMDASTIGAATFSLRQGNAPVSGTVAFSSQTATFSPSSPLGPFTQYTATVTTGAEDLAGNRLASNHVWSFTTGAAPDIKSPQVSSVDPTIGAVGVPVNKRIAATFSEAMDPLSITTGTFTLRQGSTPVAGTVAYTGITALFTPSASLAPNTAYTASLAVGATDLAGNPLASEFTWSFTTGATPDIIAPRVSSTDPANRSTGVLIGKNIAVTFSEAMDPATITTTTFTLRQGTTPVAGMVSYTGVTAIFNPLTALASDTEYTAAIRDDATDLAGNSLTIDHTWSFTTGAAADTLAPTVISTTPADAGIGVSRRGSIAVTFSEGMNPLTVTVESFTLNRGTVPVLGVVSYAGVTAIFNPAGLLDANTTYTATVGVVAEDLAGNSLAEDYVWSFTTGTTMDTTPPLVTSTKPLDGAIGVPLGWTPAALFNEAMNPLTITSATFTLDAGTLSIPGTVTYAGTTGAFTPLVDLAANTTYTAVIRTEAADLAGNALAAEYVWSFTTGLTTIQTPVNLGTTNSFAILAGSTVTNTGPSIITGDLGVSPGTAVAGFPPGNLTGTQFTGAASAAGEAQLDLSNAFADAAGRSTGPVSLPGDLAGLTLYPGLYTNATSVMLSSGTVTLDAQGDPTAVFIFQMGSTLTTGSDTEVILIGGAEAGRVFWQVGSSATLGTNSLFSGNILAEASITIATGATLQGRALTKSGAVTLDNATITVPAQ